MYFLRHPELSVVGSSPEPMVQLLDGRVISRPIAGTRRRGRSDEDDRRMAAELSEHPKERAEHVMLVDLARNDVGRVVEFGTEQVDELMTLERYSHVMHLTSQVSGRLRDGLGPIDVLRATFPAGTVSGAPKVRAMEIIDELEPTKRGPYAGVVGYVDFSGNLDTAIAIRTMLVAPDGRPACRPARASSPTATRPTRTSSAATRRPPCWPRCRVPGGSPPLEGRGRTAAYHPASRSTGQSPTRVSRSCSSSWPGQRPSTGRLSHGRSSRDYELLRTGSRRCGWSATSFGSPVPTPSPSCRASAARTWPPWRSGRRPGRSSSNPRGRSTPWSGRPGRPPTPSCSTPTEAGATP